jgi:hypothetical protein
MRQEFKLIEGLIEGGLLAEINAAELQEKFGQGSIFIGCSDCDCFRHYFGHVSGIIPRTHVHALNGGALLLDEALEGEHPEQKTALKTARQALLGATGIEGTLSLKEDMPLAVLLSHYPCGMAGILGMSLHEVIVSTLRAKKSLKERFEGLKALAVISVDWRKSEDEARSAHGIVNYTTSVKHLDAIASFFEEASLAA